ncbi:hypothetical protein HI805_13020 [Ralstonia solanacearum]|nr:hypothetical protein HI805_13020 [Ralstonia solanacearum]QKL87730.1 hypothetical protein HI803_13025 [Ralstonia solanacearum]
MELPRIKRSVVVVQLEAVARGLYLHLPPDTLSDERDGQPAFAASDGTQRKPFEKLVHVRVVRVELLKGVL